MIMMMALLALVFASLPVSMIVAQDETTSDALMGTVVVYRLRVRNAPTIAAETVATVNINEAYPVVGRNSDTSWWQIQLGDGSSGWVFSPFLVLDEQMLETMSITDIPVTAPSAAEVTPAAPAGQSSAPAGVDPDEVDPDEAGFVQGGTVELGQGQAAVDPDESGVLAVEANATIDPSLGPVGTVLVAVLRVRSAPSIADDVIATISRGQEYLVVGRTRDTRWWQIQLPDNSTGWVYSQFFEVADFENVPVVGVEENQTTISSSVTGQVLALTVDVNLREGPDTSFGIIRGIPAGLSVYVVGRNADNSWFQVIYRGSTGWVTASALPASIDVTGLPLIETALPATEVPQS
jgi:uncharacterized protein YgiM (DUF1202 family)